MASSDSELAALADYKSSLDDLDCNSKPLINVLTMLAEENQHFANGIVDIIKERILESTVKIKLPSLYLLDSILKNVGGNFFEIISKHMIGIFTNVFEKGDEKIRMSLFKLRNTWPQYFPTAFLHKLDLAVKELDPNWPIEKISPPSGSIHINPKFLRKEPIDSTAAEDISAFDSSKLIQQKEQLLAEEQRIQDRLKIFEDELQKKTVSKEEEEKLAREHYLKQQQLEREMMIREQQRQIESLKQLQKEQEANLTTAVKKNIPVKEAQSPPRGKQSDPRLPKEKSELDTLEAQKLRLKGEERESIKSGDKPKQSEKQATVENHKHCNERSGDEPSTKKRKSEYHLTEAYDDNKQPCKLNEIDKSVEHSDRGLSETTIPAANVVSHKHESTETYTEKKREEIVCESSEIGNEFQRNNRQTITYEVADKRDKRPWHRSVEQPSVRRNFRPFRGGNHENERTSRENRRMDFYPARRPRFRGTMSESSSVPSRRIINRERFVDGRQGRRQAFGAPQRLRSRNKNEMISQDEHFGEARNFYENETYHHSRDFHESRTDHPEWIREREAGPFEYKPNISNQDHHYRMHVHNQRNMPFSEEESFHPAYRPFLSRGRFLKKDNDSRSYDERNDGFVDHFRLRGEDERKDGFVDHFRLRGEDERNDGFDDHFRLRGDNAFSYHGQPYLPRYSENEDRFRPSYQNSGKLHFGEHFPSDSSSDVVEDRRYDEESFNVDPVARKTESSSRKGNVGEAYEPLVNKPTAHSKSVVKPTAHSMSVLKMIENIKRNKEPASKNEGPLDDIQPDQSQSKETVSDIEKLFEGLAPVTALPTSIFSSESVPSPPPNIETSENEIPSIGFVMEDLKTRHDSVINTLYSGMQCGNCGLRFSQDDKKFYDNHLDWHFHNNRIGRDGRKSASRTWFHMKETWMGMDDTTDYEEKAKSSVFELERKMQNAAASENSTSCSVLREDEVCNICCEPFEQFWDESLEEWRYNNATRIDGMAYHAHCYDDIEAGSDSEHEVQLEAVDIEVKGDSLCNESKDPTSIDVYAENNQLNQVNVLPHEDRNSEILKTSRNDNLHVEDNGVVQENSEICMKETPKPPKLLCNTSNQKHRGENEIT